MPIFNVFEAEIETYNLNQKIFSKGYECLMKLNCIIEEIVVEKILDPSNFVKSFSTVKAVMKLKNSVCAEKFETFANLACFTLISENKLIASGKILRYKKLN
jgi:peptide chain release factor subunit 3